MQMILAQLAVTQIHSYVHGVHLESRETILKLGIHCSLIWSLLASVSLLILQTPGFNRSGMDGLRTQGVCEVGVK